jgi:predicted PurR-regulated permease PerM
MAQRQKRLIDRKFQLKVTLSVLGVSMLAFLAIIAIVGVIASVNNRSMVRTMNSLEGAVKNETAIVSGLLEKGERPDPGTLALHEDNVSVIRGDMAAFQKFTSRNFAVLTAIIGVVLVFSLIMFIYLLSLPHRISGPMHVMQNYMNEILEGRVPEFRDLRENDEFQDFYRSFCQMATRMRKAD